MEKKQIISEIQRTAKANDGVVLGWRRFAEITRIGYYDWYGKFWSRWGDAVREAGFESNRMSEAYDTEFLLAKLITLTRKLGHVPTVGEVVIESKHDATFPSEKVFRRLGSKPERAQKIIAYCETHAGNDDIADLWKQIKDAATKSETDESDTNVIDVGYVYLLQHGTRREYKIGRTENPLRREGEVGIQLPERLKPIHYIETDDPAGIENYWHRRFASKRKEGEWFALTVDDVRAFKRWKRIN